MINVAGTKRGKAINLKLKKNILYNFTDAVELLKTLPKAKFKLRQESVDVSINLGVDPRKSDQSIKGFTVLPQGTGRELRIAAFAEGSEAQKAKEAGADTVGMLELVNEIKNGNLNFDFVVATPDSMSTVSQLGQILGPKGLMPNPKTGTVSNDLGSLVKNIKSKQIVYKTDKGGVIHCSIGTIDFTANALKENIEALIYDLKKIKPSTSKGVYMKKIYISTTMGPGLRVDISSLN